MIVKRFGCTTIHNKALDKCLIHSFIHSYREEEGYKNRTLRNPSDQLMCFGYLPSPGHPERPTGEIGFKPAKWNPSDVVYIEKRRGTRTEP